MESSTACSHSRRKRFVSSHQHRWLNLLLLTVVLLGPAPADASALRSATVTPQPARPAGEGAVLLLGRATCSAPVAGHRIHLPLIIHGPGGASSSSAQASPLPADPRAVAPLVGLPAAADFSGAIAFLFDGTDPIQMDVAPDTIDRERAAVLRGVVCTRAGAPLPGVQITILNHPEYGSTLTREDGAFDLTVNGGGLLTVVYTAVGYLQAQRQIQAPLQDFAWLPDVVLIPLDGQVTTVDLTSADPMQVAQGSTVSDDDGTRQATLLIPHGTLAEMVLPDGSTQALSVLNLRATEYTVGARGPAAMPAELPPTSGYTYALEYSVEEALAAGAVDVEFSQPLYHYVQNFLGFPVGMAVPTGYYDRLQAVWVPSQNGRVVQILNISGGLANLDTDGDGAVDNDPTLGITDAERARLAALYQTGQSLWRVAISHFTPWDCNWPYGPPPGSSPPGQPPPSSDQPPDDPACMPGSVIECQSQALGEAVDIAGTPFHLYYGSDRVVGRTAAYSLDIPLSGASLPPGLKGIELEVQIAGQRLVEGLPAAPNQRTTFTWDGKDAYGQAVLGKRPVTVRIGYVYDAVYMEPAQFQQAFAVLSGVPITGSRARQEVTLWQEWRTLLGGMDARSQALGGWSLNVHHAYDVTSGTLYLGDGGRRSVSVVGGIISTVAGGGWVPGQDIGDGGPATEAELFWPVGVDVGSDGSYYIADSQHHRIRRVGPDGIITTVAGTGSVGYNGDGIPATQANLYNPEDVALGPDGSLYIADRSNQRIRKVSPDGLISTVAGTGAWGYNGDGVRAAQAQLNDPFGIAVAPDGSLYIADTANQRIRRVGTDGFIATVAGTGEWGDSGDGGPAPQARLGRPVAVALGPDGSLYLTEESNSRVRRVGPEGIITTVAGSGIYGYNGDGLPAGEAQLADPRGIALGQDGSLFISDTGNARVRKVGLDGIITTAAGNGLGGFSGDGQSAFRAQLDMPEAVAVGPDGSLYIGDGFNHRIRRTARVMPRAAGADFLIPSADGGEVYVFTSSGRHLSTLHALTGAVLYEFSYDVDFRLLSVTDGDGNATTIERDANGNAAGIVGPYGQRSVLSSDANGYLNSVTNPANEAFQMAYTAGGLLISLINPRGQAYTFTYDPLGRLTRDDDPAGGSTSLARADLAGAYEVSVTTALGRTATYRTERPLSGGERRVDTLPGGLTSVRTESPDGIRHDDLPDGTQAVMVPSPAPRWGMLAPLAQTVIITTPAGLHSSLAVTETVTLADEADPFSLVGMAETSSINGRIYTSVYEPTSHTFTGSTPEGRVVTLTIDAQGRPVMGQVGNLLPTSYTYDSHGQLVGATQGNGASARTLSLGYNDAGYLATITDPPGRTTTLAYDDAGRVVQEIRPDGQVTGYAYDGSGNLTTIIPPGRPAHTFAYSPVGLLAEYVAPDVLPGPDQTLYTHDADRLLTRILRPDGQTVDLAWDDAGRLSALTVPRGTINYTYGATTGQLAAISAPGGINLALGYDGLLLISETWSGPVAGSSGYAYDDDLRLAASTVSGSSAVTYRYDADGLMFQAGDLTLSRDPQNGLPVGSTLGDVTDTLGYNGFGELGSYVAEHSGSSLYSAQYTRDELGRITRKTETIGGLTDTYDYDYDLVGRLVEVKKNSASFSAYGYDGNGNRLSYSGHGGTVNGTYDAQDRLLQYGSAAYSYTASGELLSKAVGAQITSYQYDALGNLMAVTLPDGTQITYLVDGANRRVGRQVNGTLVKGFLYEGDLRIAGELDSGGNLVSRFVYATRVNIPDYMVRNGATYRLILDHLGSPRMVVNVATGEIAQRLDYDEFGRVLLDTNPGFQPFGFAGGLYDPDTGLVRFGARDYDAETGRWTAKDPVLFQGGDTNLYRYAYGDPVNWSDSNGFDAAGPGDPLPSPPLGPKKLIPDPPKSGKPMKEYNKTLDIPRKGQKGVWDFFQPLKKVWKKCADLLGGGEEPAPGRSPQEPPRPPSPPPPSPDRPVY